jgi:hypothetical protein
MHPIVTAYCFAWHIMTSPAFRHLLSEPLAPFLDVEFVAPPDLADNADTPLPTTQPIIFCQRPPFPAWLADDRARIVWIPMWDLARNFPPAWWNALPKTLRVVAFSDAVAERAQNAGLPTLHLRYAKDLSQFPAVDWQAERTLMYWNRTGLISPGALRRLCETLDVRHVFFRGKLDPYVPRTASYRLPRRFGKTNVQLMPDFMPREDYRALLSQTHIYIAPRAQEGVGMTFLEAMASGCMVVAANAPTMNEYIHHEQTGILLPFDQQANERNRRLRTFKRRPFLKRWRQRLLGPSFQHPITDVPISILEQCNPETLGLAARASLTTLYQTWQSQLAVYAQFILEW